MYKPSIYNYLSPNGVLFNSMTGKIVELLNPLEVNCIFKNPTLYRDTDLWKNLVSDGFLVPVETNEYELARTRELKTIFSSRLGLIIYPTMDCNFRCSYCYQEHEKKYMSIEHQNAIISHLRRYIRDYTAVDIGWFGGEPLLALDTIENLSKNFMQICKIARRQYSATISTNGYLLSYETFKQLLSLNVLNFQITLDGDQIHHDKVRKSILGDSSYEKIIHNLMEIKKKCKSGVFSISIRTNITQDMIKDFPQHLKRMWDLFGDDRRFTFLFRPVGNWGGGRAKRLSNIFIKNMNDIYNVVLKSDYKLNYSEYYYRLLDGICEARKYNSYVYCVDGQIRKCTLAFDHDINQLGFIMKNGDLKIDQNKVYNWTIGDADVKLECDNCFYYAQCYGSSCPLKRQKGVNPTERVCGYEVENIDLVLQMIVNSKEYLKGKVLQY